MGSDPSSDIAVVKAKDASGLTPIEIGDSDDLIIGEWVMTIGSPFGLEQSVATGIVSATSRSQIMDSSTDQYGQSTGETTIYPNMIQTDAAINPGNSGGALVDADGKLIGINTLITSYSGNYSGVGFAIPVNYAVNLAQQIIDGKTPTHAQLGVSLSTVNAQNAQRYGLSVDSGAYVAAVSEGSGAAEAGLKEGDIITKFDGENVESASDLMLDVRSKNPGDKVTLEVNSNGETKQVEVTLGSDESTQSASTQQNNAQESMLERLFGRRLQQLQQDAAQPPCHLLSFDGPALAAGPFREKGPAGEAGARGGEERGGEAGLRQQAAERLQVVLHVGHAVPIEAGWPSGSPFSWSQPNVSYTMPRAVWKSSRSILSVPFGEGLEIGGLS